MYSLDIRLFTAFLPELEWDVEKWPDIHPTGTGTEYPIHP